MGWEHAREYGDDWGEETDSRRETSMKVQRIAQVTDAYVRHYSDNGDTKAYVAWLDQDGKTGRTEGALFPCPHVVLGTHMTALFARANREGIAIRGETW